MNLDWNKKKGTIIWAAQSPRFVLQVAASLSVLFSTFMNFVNSHGIDFDDESRKRILKKNLIFQGDKNNLMSNLYGFFV